MKKFITKIIYFIAIIIIIIFGIVLIKADGHLDPYYLRFTSTQQDNLILGTSRSAQGIQPHIINGILDKEFFNYSFTISHSPFGPVYLNSIKRKLNPNIKNGVFIVTVDPWSISNNSKNLNDSQNFIENRLTLANVHFVNMNPNFEYLLKEFKGKYSEILTLKKGRLFLHKNGWLEVNVTMDSVSATDRLNNKIKNYREKNLPNRELSSVRLNYLKQTVEYLKLHGKVYVVRLPISPEMLEIEQELMANFNEIINPITQTVDGYLDMTIENELFMFTDGNHLWKESGKLASEKIANWIKSITN